MSTAPWPSTEPHRQPAGVSAGGQFAHVAKAEAPVDLSPFVAPPPRALAEVLSELAEHGAQARRLEDGRRWEILLRGSGGESVFEVEVVDGEPQPDVYHHWATWSPVPSLCDDGEDDVTVDWSDPIAAASRLASRAGVAYD